MPAGQLHRHPPLKLKMEVLVLEYSLRGLVPNGKRPGSNAPICSVIQRGPGDPKLATSEPTYGHWPTTICVVSQSWMHKNREMSVETQICAVFSRGRSVSCLPGWRGSGAPRARQSHRRESRSQIRRVISFRHKQKT